MTNKLACAILLQSLLLPRKNAICIARKMRMGVRSMLGRVMSVNILASSVADMVDGDRWLTGSRLSSSWLLIPGPGDWSVGVRTRSTILTEIKTQVI